MHELNPIGLTDSQELDYAQIHERYFLKVQSKLCSVGLELLLQFFNVFRLKAANQTDRGLARVGMFFNFQCLLRETQCKPVANTNG